MRSARITFLLVILLLSGAVFIYWWWQGRLERSQDGAIRAAAQRYGVDPALVKAIVWRESRFNPSAHGKAEELGLMQIREDAAREWAEAERVAGFEHEHCLNPIT